MPNCALIPNKETSVSAERLAQLEGLGFGPDLQGESLQTKHKDPDSQGVGDLSSSPRAAQKPRSKRLNWIGQFDDVTRNILLSLLAEGREPEVV